MDTLLKTFKQKRVHMAIVVEKIWWDVWISPALGGSD